MATFRHAGGVWDKQHIDPSMCWTLSHHRNFGQWHLRRDLRVILMAPFLCFVSIGAFVTEEHVTLGVGVGLMNCDSFRLQSDDCARHALYGVRSATIFRNLLPRVSKASKSPILDRCDMRGKLKLPLFLSRCNSRPIVQPHLSFCHCVQWTSNSKASKEKSGVPSVPDPHLSLHERYCM